MKYFTITATLLLCVSFVARSEVVKMASLDVDKLQTCDTEKKVKNAKVALEWIVAYNDLNSEHFTDIKTQSCLFATGFSVWHGSLAALAAAYKGTPAFDTLPFPTGQLNEANFVRSIAFIAYANDLSKNKVIANRVDCVQDDTVAVDISFSGFQVKRDSEGYITYGVDYSAPTTKIFTFNKDHKITQQSVILDSGASVAARKKLAELLANAQAHPEQFPPLPRDERTRGTLAQLTAQLEADAANGKCRDEAGTR